MIVWMILCFFGFVYLVLYYVKIYYIFMFYTFPTMKLCWQIWNHNTQHATAVCRSSPLFRMASCLFHSYQLLAVPIGEQTSGGPVALCFAVVPTASSLWKLTVKMFLDEQCCLQSKSSALNRKLKLNNGINPFTFCHFDNTMRLNSEYLAQSLNCKL
jgi:hypothetical protein